MDPFRKRRRLSQDGTSLGILKSDTVENTHDEREDRQGTHNRRTIFVRSLPSTTTTDTLLSHFSESYPVKHAIAVADTTTKACKGYGFVTFADADDARRAIQEFNGRPLEGRKIQIEIAEPRHREDGLGQVKLNRALMAEKTTRVQGRDRDPDSRPPRLIIRNLPWSMQEPDQLVKLFMSYGKVKSSTLPKKKNGDMSGFGFVHLRGRKNAEKAIAGLNGKEIEGRTIAVDWAVDKDTWEQQKGAVQDRPEPIDESVPGMDSAVDVDDEVIGTNSPAENDEPVLDEDEPNEDEDEDAPDDGLEEEGETTTANAPTTNGRESNNASTLFIRNLPFDCTDEDLYNHFSQFGRLRYSRVVLDPTTERSRGTGFVSFVNKSEATICLKDAPRHRPQQNNSRSLSEAQPAQSVLQNDLSDPSDKYTIDGRILHVSRAVDKVEAQRLASETKAAHGRQQRDKRRLYLLSEGTISSKSTLYKHLAPSELRMREASASQRQKLIESNPTLHLSFTRLSVRNIPRTITSKDLKALAREAIVSFATDVREGIRQPLSKEELERGGEEMREAEHNRKKKGKGVVKQAKIVFEGREGSKINESSGAGRSRGYGFIEYYTHRSALMGLRWLNGHSVAYQANDAQGRKLANGDAQDRNKRLIVEFAIENVQVVGRRKERESKARDRAKTAETGTGDIQTGEPLRTESSSSHSQSKRKRDIDSGAQEASSPRGVRADTSKTAKRQQIIARKRLARKQRKKAVQS